MSKTDNQEDGSKWIFQRALKNNVNYTKLMPTNQFISKKEQGEVISAYENSNPKKKLKWPDWMNVKLDKRYSELQKIFDPTFNIKKDSDPIPDKWLLSYFGQQKALLDKYSAPQFKEARFDRGENFMEFVDKMFRKAGGSGNINTWNPADLWIVDTKKEPDLEKKLEETIKYGSRLPNNIREKDEKIQELNSLLRGYYRKSIVIGVSLKQTDQNAIYVPVNVLTNEEKTMKEFDIIKNLRCEISEIVCKLNIKPVPVGNIELFKSIMEDVGVSTKYYPDDPMSFHAKHTEIFITDNYYNVKYKFDIMSTDVRYLKNLKYEPGQVGKTLAKLGQAGVKDVDKIFGDYGVNFKNDHNQYLRKIDDKEIDKIVDKFNKSANKAGVKFSSSIASDKEFKTNLKIVYKSDLGAAVSKLMQLDLISELLSLSDKELSKLLTDIVFFAQKKGKKYGPFGKVY